MFLRIFGHLSLLWKCWTHFHISKLYNSINCSRDHRVIFEGAASQVKVKDGWGRDFPYNLSLTLSRELYLERHLYDNECISVSYPISVLIICATPASASPYSYNWTVSTVTRRSMAKNRVIIAIVAVILILVSGKYWVDQAEAPSLPTGWISTANLNTSHYLVGGEDLVQPRVGKGGKNCTIIFIR